VPRKSLLKKTLTKSLRGYLRKNKNISINILACESRDQVLLIHVKNRREAIPGHLQWAQIELIDEKHPVQKIL